MIIFIPDDLILFGASMDCMVFILSEVDKVNSILLGVDTFHRCSLLTIVNDDLIVCAAGNYIHPIVAVVYVRNLVLIFIVYFGHPHGPKNIFINNHPSEIRLSCLVLCLLQVSYNRLASLPFTWFVNSDLPHNIVYQLHQDIQACR